MQPQPQARDARRLVARVKIIDFSVPCRPPGFTPTIHCMHPHPHPRPRPHTPYTKHTRARARTQIQRESERVKAINVHTRLSVRVFHYGLSAGVCSTTRKQGRAAVRRRCLRCGGGLWLYVRVCLCVWRVCVTDACNCASHVPALCVCVSNVSSVFRSARTSLCNSNSPICCACNSALRVPACQSWSPPPSPSPFIGDTVSRSGNNLFWHTTHTGTHTHTHTQFTMHLNLCATCDPKTQWCIRSAIGFT